MLGPCGWWERERRAFKTFLEFAWCTTERYQSHVGKGRFVWSTEGEEHWHELVAKNRGFVMLTAHLGNWEVGSMLPAAREQRTVHLVREEELNPAAQRFVSGMLARAGAHRYVTHFAASDPELGLRLVEALRHGDIVALQGDRPRAGGRSVPGRLFGRPMSFPAGVPALARAAHAPLVPVFVLREGRSRYRVIIKPPIELPPALRREDAEALVVGEFAAQLESVVRRAPHQWFCFGPLWPSRRDQTR